MRLRALPAVLAMSLALVGSQASADPFRPSMKDQVELGQRAAEEFRKENEMVPDSDARVRLMRRIGNRLVNTIPADERKNRPFEYSFDLVQDDTVNAFALPGGPIFFFTGIYDIFETEDELAGVLAHEIVHVRNQHWASAYADNQKRRLGVSALLLILGAGDTAFDIASVGDLLFTLDYSRRHEAESDRIAVRMLLDAGYNPEGLAVVFEKFQEIKSGGRPPEFLNTHPDDKNRVRAIRNEIEKQARGRPLPSMRPLQPRLNQGLDRGRD